MQTFRVNGFHFFLDFPQGAGRGEEPLTYFGNHFYPYAGGDAFTSYSNSGSYCSTKGYGVLVDASQYTTVQFVTTQDKNKVDVSEFMPTEVIVKMIRDYNRGAEEVGVGAKVERFGLVLFGRDGDGDGSGGEDLLAAVGRELGRLGARGRAGVDAPGATGAGAAGPDDPDVDSGLDFRLPDWTQRGAIIGLEGGTQAVDEKLNSDFLKTKIRLRHYGSLPGGTPVGNAFLEAKFKLGSCRRKLRAETDWSAQEVRAMDLGGPELQRVPELLLQDVWGLHGEPPGPLLPVFEVTYHRFRFVEPRSGARLSIDTQIQVSRVNRSRLPAPRKLPLGRAVLEVKGEHQALPQSLADLNQLGCKREAFSKFGVCYNWLRYTSH